MKRLLIVGAGITGLLAALKLCKNYEIIVIDQGLDPRLSQNPSGATYSGLDARHISFTETAPWTSQHRFELIMKSSLDGGWLCIPQNDLNDFEKEWIAQFQLITNDNKLHTLNTQKVISLNIRGVAEWEKLGVEHDFLKPISNETVMPIICRSKEDLLGEFNFEHSLDKRTNIFKGNKLPKSLSPLNPKLDELGQLGYFTLYGRTYQIKTLCTSLINYLNLTPVGSALLISGGYGFVGNRPYKKAVKLAQPIMDLMVSEIRKWLPGVRIKENAFCIRPATPSGVSVLEKRYLDKTPIIFAVGHSAGGFTQAPYTAMSIEREISI